MIITKAYIKSIPEEGDNIFTVNVPLMADNVNDEAVFDALLCVSPGSYNDYKEGDCVFVGFEDDKYNIAIIFGKLFVNVPEDNDAYGLFNQLNVTGSVVLPEDTKIGNYTPQDIFNLYQGVENGTGGSINPDDLKQYVQWTNTERILGLKTFGPNNSTELISTISSIVSVSKIIAPLTFIVAIIFVLIWIFLF